MEWEKMVVERRVVKRLKIYTNRNNIFIKLEH